MDANIRGTDVGVLKNLQDKCTDEQIEAVLENEAVQNLLTEAGIEDLPSSALDLTDTIELIKSEDKYKELPNKLIELIKTEFPQI